MVGKVCLRLGFSVDNTEITLRCQTAFSNIVKEQNSYLIPFAEVHPGSRFNEFTFFATGVLDITDWQLNVRGSVLSEYEEEAVKIETFMKTFKNISSVLQDVASYYTGLNEDVDKTLLEIKSLTTENVPELVKYDEERLIELAKKAISTMTT